MSDDDRDFEEVMDRLDELKESIDPEADLEPMSPREAREDWLDRQEEKADSTIRSYEDRTIHFIRFCDDQGIDDLNDLSTRDIKQYESERISQGITESTQKNEWGTLARMLEHAVKLNAVLPEVAEALDVPELSKDQRINTETLPAQRAQEILDNLERYEYASREHVSFMLIWRTTMRLGAIYGLDLGTCTWRRTTWSGSGVGSSRTVTRPRSSTTSSPRPRRRSSTPGTVQNRRTTRR